MSSTWCTAYRSGESSSAHTASNNGRVLDDDALFVRALRRTVRVGVRDGFGVSRRRLSEDFLGLKELGIAAEFGLSSLSIPRGY